MKKFLIAAVDRLNGHQVAGFGTSATLKRLGLMSDSEPSWTSARARLCR